MQCGVVATYLTCLARGLSPAAASVLTIYLLGLSIVSTLLSVCQCTLGAVTLSSPKGTFPLGDFSNEAGGAHAKGIRAMTSDAQESRGFPVASSHPYVRTTGKILANGSIVRYQCLSRR